MQRAGSGRAGRALAGAAALSAAFGLGFALGREDPPPRSPSPVERGTALAGASASEGHPRARALPGVPAGDASEASHPVHEGEPPAGDAAVAAAPLDLDAKLARMRALRDAAADEHQCDQAYQAAEELQAAVEADPEALARALERLRSSSDPAELELLAAVLGRVRDLEVEETAVDLTRAPDPAAQAAGYDMLDALDLPSARAASLEGLQRSRDPAVRRAALRALPAPVGASVNEAGEVVASLVGVVASDPDPELRRRAAVELGRWHRDPADLAGVLQALERDLDPNVRAGAAFGLELSGRRDPAVVQALVQAMRRPDEDPLVRENAWKALGALGPLAPEDQAEWRRFQDELAATEGG